MILLTALKVIVIVPVEMVVCQPGQKIQFLFGVISLGDIVIRVGKLLAEKGISWGLRPGE